MEQKFKEAYAKLTLPDEHIITVCDNCLKAVCWHGYFMCDNARYAATIEKTIKELKELQLEHPSYWEAIERGKL